MTGIDAKNVSKKKCLKFNGIEIFYSRTFDDKIKNKPFWYVNSLGLIEIAQYGASVSQLYNISVSDKIS